MTHFGPEQSGFDDTAPLLTQTQREQAWNELKSYFEDPNATDLEAYYDPKSKRLKGTKLQRMNPNLPLEIKLAFRKSVKEKLIQQQQEIREA